MLPAAPCQPLLFALPPAAPVPQFRVARVSQQTAQAAPRAQPQRRRPSAQWIQQPLPRRNDPPRRVGRLPPEKPRPLWMRPARQWLIARFEAGAGCTAAATALLYVIRLMYLDDVIVWGAWRLEFVWLAAGYPHYRLLWRDRLYGVADVPVTWGQPLSACRQWRPVQRQVATMLSLMGCRADHLVLLKGAALTGIDAAKEDLPPLLTLTAQERALLDAENMR